MRLQRVGHQWTHIHVVPSFHMSMLWLSSVHLGLFWVSTYLCAAVYTHDYVYCVVTLYAYICESLAVSHVCICVWDYMCMFLNIWAWHNVCTCNSMGANMLFYFNICMWLCVCVCVCACACMVHEVGLLHIDNCLFWGKKWPNFRWGQCSHFIDRSLSYGQWSIIQ